MERIDPHGSLGADGVARRRRGEARARASSFGRALRSRLRAQAKIRAARSARGRSLRSSKRDGPMGVSAIIRRIVAGSNSLRQSSVRIIRSADGAVGLAAYPVGHVDIIIAPAHVRCFHHARSKDGGMIVEIAVIVLSVVCFVILDFYVLGCEKV